MSREETHGIAAELLSRLGAGADPGEIVTLFSPHLDWNVPGDSLALPWIGRKTGRRTVLDFVRDSRALLEPVRFEVHEIFTSDSRAVILGELASKVKATGRTIETEFAIVLTVSGGEIARFLMLEDGFAVSEAARP